MEERPFTISGRSVGVGLGGDALVAVAGGAGLAGIDAGDDQKLIFHLLLKGDKAVDIVQHRILPVRRTRADDEEHPGVLTREDVGNLYIPPGLGGDAVGGQGDGLLDLLGGGELPKQFHICQGVHGLIRPFCIGCFPAL